MILNITIIILLTLGAISVSVFSITGSHEVWKRSLLQKFGSYWESKTYSSVNKWKNGRKSEGERFPFSSTLLSCITDAWHMGVLLTIVSFSAAGILTGLQLAGNENIGDLVQMIMLWIITYAFVFNFTYHYVLLDDSIPAWQIFLGVFSCLVIGALGLQFGLFDNGWIFLWIIAPVFVYIALAALLTVIGLFRKLGLYILKAFK